MNVHAEIMKRQDTFSQGAPLADELGRIPEESARALKDSGIIRMFQPREFGGMEAHGPDPYLVDTLTLAQNGPENARDHNAEEHLHR